MFRVTLVNLSPDLTSASLGLGRSSLGELPRERVIALLDAFRSLDPVENFDAEPEIVLETRSAKFLVRMVRHRLYLYNPRRIDEPALELSAEQITAEVDGSAAARRTLAPFHSRIVPASAADRPAVPLPPPRPPENLLTSRQRLAFAAALVVLCGYVAYPSFLSKPPDPAAAFTPLADSERARALKEQFAGVFVTGNDPGDRGIALSADGTIRLFELNDDSEPSLVQSTFRVGQIAGAVALRGREIGGPILPQGRTALAYAGEIYRRVE